MKVLRHITVLIALSGMLCAAASQQQIVDPNGVPTFVEIYWQWSRTLSVPPLSNIVVLDPDIAKVEPVMDGLQIYGIGRGETVVLGYLHDKPVSIRVRVIQRPIVTIPPSLLRRQGEMAQGIFGSTAQIANGNGQTTTSVVSNLTWAEPAGGDGRLYVNTQVEDNDFVGGHAFNIRHGSIAYRSPELDVSLLDNLVSLTNNGPQHYVTPLAYSDSVELRGAAVNFKHGANQFLFFGGTTIPSYFLTLGATRDIGGFSFVRQQTEKLSLFATTSYINSPVDLFNFTGARQEDWMQTGGVTYHPDENWTFQGTGGASTHGGMGRGELNYISHRLTFFAAGGSSSLLFPLNRVQSLFSGNTSAKAGVTLVSSERFTESLYYQHTITQSFANLLHAGSSDYLTPGLGWKVDHKDDLNINYTFSRNEGGFANLTSTGNRVDTIWRRQITPLVSNAAQLTVGSLQDPLQLNSEDEFTLRESVYFPVKGGTMMVGVEHDRRNPSLVHKLASELQLLSPALQQLFLQDPISFVDSNNVPPEVKALLDSQVPISTSITASAQFRWWKKLSFNPSFALARSYSGQNTTWTPFVSYALNYQMRPSFELTSGLSNVWTFNSQANAVQRTTLLYFGFVKHFSAMPGALLPTRHAGRIIEGRVFRDNNVNGTFNLGEQGMAGMQVRLDDGQVAETDEQGRYKFGDVTQGEHTVSFSLTQFAAPVRMTTKNLMSVDLIRQKIAIVDFGVVDFARVTGTIFNDLRFDGTRQPDAKGVAGVHLLLDNGQRQRTLVVHDNGDFEADDVPPGDYKISVDPATLPANYTVPQESFTVRVAPVTTVVQNIPARAMRSIAGRVFVKVLADSAAQPADSGKLKIGGMPAGGVRNQRGGQAGGGRVNQSGRGQAQGANGVNTGGDYNLVPLAGVQITAGYGMVKTDENGNFLLRDLPAGELTVTLVPQKDLPTGLKVPSGQVKMPAEPIQVQGATIVISNPELTPFLVDAPKQ